MTQYLSGLSDGDFIEIRGPSGLVTYEGLGKLCYSFFSCC